MTGRVPLPPLPQLLPPPPRRAARRPVRRPARRRAAALLLAASIAGPLGAAAARAELSLPDARGGQLRLAAPPQRIVSLLPSLTESVCALGGCARLVGTDRFSNWPPEVQRLPKLGGLDDVRIESVVALRPDVVLAAPSQRVAGRLEALGLAVWVVDVHDLGGVHDALYATAALLGTPERAAPAWRDVEQAFAAAAAKVPAAWHARAAYVEVDAGPYAAGPASFIGGTLHRLGLGNIVPPALGEYPKLNPEFVVRAQPALIVAARRALDEMPARPGWAALHALQAHRGCAFDPASMDLLVRPGPRVGEGALQLAECIAGLSPPP